MRKYHYDYLRVLAMIGIIGAHCTAAFVDSAIDRNTISWWYGSFLQHIVRIGLPIFFMLSGSLALNRDYPCAIQYYKNRIVKILLPFLVYSCFYVAVSYDFSANGPLKLIPYYIKCVITGNVSYHLWFVYSIIGLYLCTPFLTKMLHSMSRNMLSLLVVFMLAVQILKIYPPFVGIHVEIDDFIFSGWVLYYILGYYLSQKEIYSKIPSVLLAAAFLVSLILTEIIWWWYPQYANGMYDFSLTMILMSCAVFVWFEKKAGCFPAPPASIYKAVSFVGNYSYSIYLIHAMVLSELVGTRMGITIYWSNYIISSTVRILLVFIISLSVSIAVDTCLVKPLQKILSKVLSV